MTEIILIPWEDENYRGWYCDFNGRLCWKSGYSAGRNIDTDIVEANYYNLDDDDIAWQESPIPLSKYSVKPEDEYDIEADERAEEAEEGREAAKERRYYGRYLNSLREDWN